MKKLFVSRLIALLLLSFLVINALAAPGTAGRQVSLPAFTDLSAGQRYWSHYQNPPATTAFTDLSAGQRYWSYYQNPPATTIMPEITSK